MMKKRVALLLAVLLILSVLAACGNKNSSARQSDLQADDSVVATFERVESRDETGKVQTVSGAAIYDCYTFESIDSESVMITDFYSQTKGKTASADAETQSYVRCIDPHTVIIPEKLADKTVVKIAQSAFYARSELANLILPETVTTIDRFAFAECVNLQAVTLPAAVSELGMAAFYRCEKMSELRFADGSALTEISKTAFAFCQALTEVHIPAAVKTIGDGAFLNCTSVAALTLPEGLETIGDQAFQNLNLADVPELPESVTSVGILNPWAEK